LAVTRISKCGDPCYVAAQVGGIAHNLLVTHVTCLEHGEIIHSVASPSARAVSPTESVERSGEPGHDHDICLIALSRRERTQCGIIAAAPAQPLPLSSVAHFVAAEAPLFEGAPVFHLAPKTSPPV
jgi:hypothetical protein